MPIKPLPKDKNPTNINDYTAAHVSLSSYSIVKEPKPTKSQPQTTKKTINNKPKPAIAKAQIHGNQERNRLPPATPPPSLKSLIRTPITNVNKQNTFFKE